MAPPRKNNRNEQNIPVEEAPPRISQGCDSDGRPYPTDFEEDIPEQKRSGWDDLRGRASDAVESAKERGRDAIDTAKDYWQDGPTTKNRRRAETREDSQEVRDRVRDMRRRGIDPETGEGPPQRGSSSGRCEVASLVDPKDHPTFSYGSDTKANTAQNVLPIDTSIVKA